MIKILQKIILLTLIGAIFLSYASEIHAQEYNKYGFHLANVNHDDIKDIAKIVNSNGGDWGYITLVIQENNRSHENWQNTFDLLREQHLIPIVRIATRANGDFWERASEAEAENWVSFLDGLNWPVRERYIVLFNEPNHGSEWGGQCDPESYFRIAKHYTQKLNDRHGDFFVMMAGLDQAAPQQPGRYCSAHYFITEGSKAVPDLIPMLDGLASHSYPNPGFVGSPSDTGWKSIVGYRNELELLQSLGARANLPVFITETGYPTGSSYFVESVANQYLQSAFNIWNSDPRVQAYTLFDYRIGGALRWFSYVGEAYAKPNILAGIQGFSKTKGNPARVENAYLLSLLPEQLPAQHTHEMELLVKNVGQTTWSPEQEYSFDLDGAVFPIESSAVSVTKPGETMKLLVQFTPVEGEHKLRLNLTKSGKVLAQVFDWNLVAKKPSPITIDLQPGSSAPTTVQLFDTKEKLIYEKTIYAQEGNVVLEDFLGEEGKVYRLVVLQDKFLPVQKHFQYTKNNYLSMSRTFGVDLNGDGKFSWADFL